MNQFVDVIPILDVHDVNKALDYYVEKLGFQIRDTKWGTREFAIRDLDGNGLIFYRDL